ncbi:MAG: permease-like cell division protein FtsX [Alistipes sp.]|nr:permease-like cell division protein FtsX [Candidatus Minthomonas equi]
MSSRENNILKGRIVRSYISSVVSISLVLFLTGIAGILMANAHTVADYFRENLRLSAMLNIEADDTEAAATADEISRLRFVKGVDIISREEGILEMKKILGEDFMDVFNSSPIPISIDITLLAPFIHQDSLSIVKHRIEEISSVKEVVYQESLIDMLNANIQKIGVILGIFITLLLFISTVLISNTVRLNVYSKRFTIRTMRLVGATKAFITGPFVGKAFFQGLFSGLIAVLALLGVIYAIKQEFYQLYTLFDLEAMLYVMASVTGIGIIICMLATSNTVRKLISLTTDELYF